MKIYKVTKKDFSDWVDLGAEFWFRWKKEDIKKEFKKILSSKNEQSFICRDKDESPVGFINVAIRFDYVEGSKTNPVGYLEGIYVIKEYRKKGIAKMLMKEADKWFIKKGVSEIGSDTDTKNIASQNFHKSVGFKKGETLVHYIKKI